MPAPHAGTADAGSRPAAPPRQLTLPSAAGAGIVPPHFLGGAAHVHVCPWSPAGPPPSPAGEETQPMPSRSAPNSIRRTLLACLALLPMTGCTQLLLTSMYFIKGVETPAEFKELKGTKTAVVCRPLVELQYSSSSAAEQLARVTGILLKSRIKKIEIVRPDLIEQWTDEHDWDEFTEVGKAVKAERVVGIEIEEFSLYQGQTLYQGRARVKVTVHDMQQNGDVVFERALPEIIYPPNAGIPTSEKAEEEFRKQFIGVVADRIGRFFYSFDHRNDAAMDSTAL